MIAAMWRPLALTAAVDHLDWASQRYAILEGKHNFTLVRWRQIMERGRGHSMTGQIAPKRISWTFGVQNGRGLSHSKITEPGILS